MAKVDSKSVKLAHNVAHVGVMFPVVGGYDVEVDGEEYPQCVRLVGGYIEVGGEDVAVFSWEASDDNGVHEKGDWYDSKEEAIAAAREHVEANDGDVADHCG